MKKPRFKNRFFMFPVMAIFLNYLIMLFFYYAQNSDNVVLGILEDWIGVSLLIIILCFIIRIVFLVMRKINVSEFLIGIPLNLTGVFILSLVIGDRI